MDILARKDLFVEAAQKVLDAWRQDEKGVDEELGTGGACDLVAQALGEVLDEQFPDVGHATQWSEMTTHTSVIVRLSDGVHELDIHHSVYEQGFGYVWRKRENVILTGEDISLVRLDQDPANYCMYIDE